MMSIDLARQLAADRQRALRASGGPRRDRRTRRTRQPRNQPHPIRHPFRRLLEWLDRVTPITGAAAPC